MAFLILRKVVEVGLGLSAAQAGTYATESVEAMFQKFEKPPGE